MGTLKLNKSEFTRPEKASEFPNPSGIKPVEFKVLVKPYEMHETDEVIKSAKAAGIEIAESEYEREQMTQVIALVISVGGNAFEDWKGQVPSPGGRIIMAKFAGLRTEGIDGRYYRIISDKDICAVLFKPDMDAEEMIDELQEN